MRSTPEAVNEYLSAELDMTMAALKGHPKVYWIWNHRNWCLGNVPPGPGAAGQADAQGWRQANWDRELYVVEKMLDADARNCERPPVLRRALRRADRPPSPLSFSHGVELPALRAREHARAPAGEGRARVHDAQDRGELLELQRVAPAHEGPRRALGVRRARPGQVPGGR